MVSETMPNLEEDQLLEAVLETFNGQEQRRPRTMDSCNFNPVLPNFIPPTFFIYDQRCAQFVYT